MLNRSVGLLIHGLLVAGHLKFWTGPAFMIQVLLPKAVNDRGICVASGPSTFDARFAPRECPELGGKWTYASLACVNDIFHSRAARWGIGRVFLARAAWPALGQRERL